MGGPELSPVGSGLSDNIQTDAVTQATSPDVDPKKSWQGGPADYFRDARARQVGDLVTIKVAMNDNANFNSTSGGQRKAAYTGSATADTPIPLLSGTGSLSSSMSASSSGQGSVTRSEKLNVAVAAMVRRVLPNGSLYVEGSQETLVNFEKRVVRVSGIVDPRNISADNTIDSDKIAEARIAYGGSGSSNDQQKPRWGLQLWDKITPF
nr:flagellar basal body L-ring protein FlgH [Aestuariivirga litoralis]